MARGRALVRVGGEKPAPTYRARVLPRFPRRSSPRFLQAVPPSGRPSTSDTMLNPLVGGRTGFIGKYGWDPSLSENPDEVLQARRDLGAPPYPYQEMLKNPYVRAALQRLKGEILGARYDIQAASDDPIDVEIADFVRWNLDPAKEEILLAIWQMLECINDGYSITAKVWDTVAEGDWAGHWYIREFRTKNPKDWRILCDQYRNVLGFQEAADRRGPIYPPHYAVLLSWDARYGNPYGNAALQCVRAAYEALVYVTKQRLKYLEHFAKPARIGKAGSNDEKQRELFFQALKKWGDEFVLVTPDKDWDVDLVQAVSDAGAFQQTAEYFAREIAIGILGAHLQMMEGGQQGSRAAAETHASEASTPATLAGMLLRAELGRQVIKELVDWNYSGVTKYPKMVKVLDDTLDYPTLLALRQYMEILQMAMRSGIDIGADWFRDIFNIPVPEEEEELVYPAEAQTPGPGGPSTGGGDPFAGDGGDGTEEEDDGEPADEDQVEDDEKDGDAMKKATMSDKPNRSPRIPSRTPAKAARAMRRMVADMDRADRVGLDEYEKAARSLFQEINQEMKKKARPRFLPLIRVGRRPQIRSGRSR